jgi:hypothetical protein
MKGLMIAPDNVGIKQEILKKYREKVAEAARMVRLKTRPMRLI